MNYKQKGCLIALISNVVGFLSMIGVIFAFVFLPAPVALICMAIAISLPVGTAFLMRHYLHLEKKDIESLGIGIKDHSIYRNFFGKKKYITGAVIFVFSLTVGLLCLPLMRDEDRELFITMTLFFSALISVVAMFIGRGVGSFYAKRYK